MKSIILLVLFVVMITGCSSSVENIPVSSKEPAGNQLPQVNQVPAMTTKSYSLSDIATHSTKDDCWIGIHGKVYDVTKYIPNHPGKDAIIAGCGTDATVLFETRPIGSGTPHSEKARGKMTDYYIGELKS